MTKPLVSVVAAARPNLMKVHPVLTSLSDAVDSELIHTGQHYDAQMSDAFFTDLGLPPPDVHLGIGSGTHAEQTGRTLMAMERHLVERRPAAVVVVGDVNATLASGLAATKLGIPVAHVEAGLRSGDWSMPEEVNRVLVDRLSDWLFTYSEDADDNLRAEGIDARRIHRVGNVMIDSLKRLLPRARSARSSESLGVTQPYGLVTLHRPSNVDDPTVLSRLVDALNEVSSRLPLVFPVHPRTRPALESLDGAISERVSLVDPLGYLDFLSLMDSAAVVLTDSGGIQEETTILGVPCVTVRTSTERPITLTTGTNRLVGTDPERIVEGAEAALAQGRTECTIELWDGKAGVRIAEVLENSLV